MREKTRYVYVCVCEVGKKLGVTLRCNQFCGVGLALSLNSVAAE